METAGVYRHYKGKYYQVLSPAVDADTGEKFVLYRQMYEPFGYWLRPWDMFFGTLEKEGKTLRRFTPVGKEAPDGGAVPEDAAPVHSETLEIYRILSRDGGVCTVRGSGKKAALPR